MNDWVEQETASCRMHDERAKKRLGVLLKRLAEKSMLSIPAACQGWAETQAAYRFLQNPRVRPQAILHGHVQATWARIRAEPVVLVVQDTTFVEWVRDAGASGVGRFRKTERTEYLLHPSVAFTPARVNLGLLGERFWQRPAERVGHLRAKKPIAQKESVRWLEGYEWACQVQAHCPETLVISVADREGDIHEWFLAASHRALAERAEFIIRAKCNRRVEGEDEDGYLWEVMTQAPALGAMELEVAGRPHRKARTANLQLKAQALTFNRARRAGGCLPPVEVYAVYAKERNAPKGEEPLEWMLLTSLPVEDFATAQTIVGWYRVRWEVELYFRILKQGCRVEDLRLETPERLERCLALYLIVAWRIHQVTMLSRCMPTEKCTAVFSDPEWKTIYLLQTKKRPPSRPPRLREITRKLAQLGGFLARTRDGEPGVETIWRGFMVLQQSLLTLEITQAMS